MTALASPSRICFRGSRAARWAAVIGRRIMSTYFTAASRIAFSPARAICWRCSGVGRQTTRTMWYSDRRIGRNCWMNCWAWPLLTTTARIRTIPTAAHAATGAGRLVATARGAGAALSTRTGCSCPLPTGTSMTLRVSTTVVIPPGTRTAGRRFDLDLDDGDARLLGGRRRCRRGLLRGVGLVESLEKQGRGDRRDGDGEGHHCGGNPLGHRRASSTCRCTSAPPARAAGGPAAR